jgi:hypothetical protein
MTIIVVLLRLADTVGWLAYDQPAQMATTWQAESLHGHIDIIKVLIAMGAIIVGRCHDVTNSKR